MADAINREGLREQRITTVVSVHDEHQPEIDGIHSVHLRCADRSDANILQLLGPAADHVSRGLLTGGSVLIHCLEGRSRSASVAVAYLIRHQGMSLRDAFKKVQHCRPMVQPNRGFWRQLVAFEEASCGTASLTEDELPGTVMFEQASLDRIISEYKHQ